METKIFSTKIIEIFVLCFIVKYRDFIVKLKQIISDNEIMTRYSLFETISYYTPPNDSGGVLWFHVGCPCVCLSICLSVEHQSDHLFFISGWELE